MLPLSFNGFLSHLEGMKRRTSRHVTCKKGNSHFLDRFLKTPSFKIATSGWAGGHQTSSKVYLLVNLFSKLYVTFILQWIVFIFGRDEQEDQ